MALPGSGPVLVDLGDVLQAQDDDAERQWQERNPQGQRPDGVGGPAPGQGLVEVMPARPGEQAAERQAQSRGQDIKQPLGRPTQQIGRRSTETWPLSIST